MSLDWSKYPNFSEREMACRHCGRADMDPMFMRVLQALRDELGFPLVISSGYRCPEHNASVSTTGRDGPHTTGRAADIKIHGHRARLLIAHAGFFSGIGVKQNGPHAQRFIHLDTLDGEDDLRPWVWSY